MSLKSRIRCGLALIMASVAVAVVPVASAQAEPFNLSVSDAVLDLGTLKGVRAIVSDATPPDPPATLTGTVDAGTVNVPKDDFVFFPKTAEVQPGVNAVINMSANQDITGSYDSATGSLDLAVSLKATVDVLGSTCVISPINLTLSTENGKPYLGERFAAGLAGQGAVSASWTGLPPVTGGGMCPTIAGLLAGKGGIWMAQNIYNPKTCDDQPSHPGCGDVPTAPDTAPNITSGPTGKVDSTTATFTFEKGLSEPQEVTGFVCKLDDADFAPCDSGTVEYTGLADGLHSFTVRAKNGIGEGPALVRQWTVDTVVPPQPKPAKFGPLKVAPATKAVKRGKKATIKVTVRNIGETATAGAKVCATAPKALVKVNKCVSLGAIAPGKSKVAKFTVKVNKKAKKGKKAVIKLKATASKIGAKSGKATVKIK